MAEQSRTFRRRYLPVNNKHEVASNRSVCKPHSPFSTRTSIIPSLTAKAFMSYQVFLDVPVPPIHSTLATTPIFYFFGKLTSFSVYQAAGLPRSVMECEILNEPNGDPRQYPD